MFIFVFTCSFQCAVLSGYQGVFKKNFRTLFKTSTFCNFFLFACLFFKLKTLFQLCQNSPVIPQVQEDYHQGDTAHSAKPCTQDLGWPALGKRIPRPKAIYLVKRNLKDIVLKISHGWHWHPEVKYIPNKVFCHVLKPYFSVFPLLLFYTSHSGSELFILSNCYLPHLKVFTIFQGVEWICLCIVYLLVTRKQNYHLIWH